MLKKRRTSSTSISQEKAELKKMQVVVSAVNGSDCDHSPRRTMALGFKRSGWTSLVGVCASAFEVRLFMTCCSTVAEQLNNDPLCPGPCG